jgi:hypothetical protein
MRKSPRPIDSVNSLTHPPLLAPTSMSLQSMKRLLGIINARSVFGRSEAPSQVWWRRIWYDWIPRCTVHCVPHRSYSTFGQGPWGAAESVVSAEPPSFCARTMHKEIFPCTSSVDHGDSGSSRALQQKGGKKNSVNFHQNPSHVTLHAHLLIWNPPFPPFELH